MPAFRALEESIGGLREASRGTDVANFFCPIEPRAKTAQEAPAPDSLAALARENHGDLAEKGIAEVVLLVLPLVSFMCALLRGDGVGAYMSRPRIHPFA